jgi:hypothetical protein
LVVAKRNHHRRSNRLVSYGVVPPLRYGGSLESPPYCYYYHYTSFYYDYYHDYNNPTPTDYDN